MKQEVTADAGAGTRPFRAPRPARRSPRALRAPRTAADSESVRRARRVPYQREYGWHAVWSHEFVFPTFREQPEPVLQLVRDQVAGGLRLPGRDRRRR